MWWGDALRMRSRLARGDYYKGSVWREGDVAFVHQVSQWYAQGVRAVTCLKNVRRDGYVRVMCSTSGIKFLLHSSLLSTVPAPR